MRNDRPFFVVTRFGAANDGKTLTTAALQEAIDSCAGAGGGVVLVPPGRFLTGALFLRSRVEVRLEAGATLLASPHPADFPPIKSRDEGIERTVYASLLTGVDLEDVAVSGAGQIDGQGTTWLEADDLTHKLRLSANLPREADNPPAAPLRWPRPRMINLIRCRRATIEGITLKDGPSINIHLLYCEDARVQRVRIYQQAYIRGSDGIVIDSSRRVHVARCTLSTGSDCIGIKSGYNEDGRRVGLPSEDIVISECQIVNTLGSALVIGSETAGSIRNVLMRDCLVRQCFGGVRIRSPRGRGGVVERICVSNTIIEEATEMAVKISHFFDSVRIEGRFQTNGPARHNVELARSVKRPIDEGTPTFRDFAFSGLTIGKVREVAVVEGLPERPIRGIAFEDISVAQAKGGISSSLVADLRIANVTVDTLESPAVDARESERVEVHRLRCARPARDVPLVWMETVSGALIHACQVADGGPDFSWVRHDQCRDIVFAENAAPGEPGVTRSAGASGPPR